MSVIRPEIEALRPTGIARVAVPRLNDPNVIPLWFGEGDIVTPDFIRAEAKAALVLKHAPFLPIRDSQAISVVIKNGVLVAWGRNAHTAFK